LNQLLNIYLSNQNKRKKFELKLSVYQFVAPCLDRSVTISLNLQFLIRENIN